MKQPMYSSNAESMAQRPKRRLILIPAIRATALFVCLLTLPLALGAQEPQTVDAISGTVLDAASLQPLANVQVGIEGTSVSAITNAQGQFRLTRVPGGDVAVTVSLIGYRQLKQNVRAGASGVRLMLATSPVELNQIVVTGTPGASQKRAIGNSVATVKASDIQAMTASSSVGNLLSGRVAGVVVVPGTGQVGSGPRIRIRGANSFSLTDQPLIFVDGIRVDNDVARGPRSQGTSSVISRLNDFNPDDIESFEVIKGPAAATLYGTEAANGVIQIITKKGSAEGRSKLDVSARIGNAFVMDPGSKIPISYWRNPAGEVLTWDPVAAEDARGTPLFDTGIIQSFNANMSGGSPTTRYYVSGSYDKQGGVEVTNKLNRFTTRASLNLHPSSKLNANFSLGFTQASTELPLEGSSGRGMIVNAAFGSPQFLDGPKRGFLTAPPEVLHSPSFRSTSNLRRFTQSAQLTFDAFSWLSQKLTAGIDIVGEEDQALTKRDESLSAFFNATTVAGSKSTARRDVTYTTVDYSATARATLRDDVSSSSSAGFQFYRRKDVRVEATGREFPAPDLQTIAATAITTGFDDFEENTTVGVYVQQQLGWRDLAFLTGAVRVDNNSAFGENFDFVVYPKVSGTYVLSDQGSWGQPLGISTLKLRAAYGQSGQQPRSFAALRTYQPVTGGNGLSAVTPQFVGNPDLAPERGSEIEAGFDAGLFEDRIGMDFTFYYRQTKDAILEKATAPSMGFPGTQYVNAGKIQNRGIELQLKGTPISRSNLNLDLSLNVSRNSNKVIDLGGAEFFNVVEDGTGFITPLNSGRHQLGYPLGGWWGKEVVSATVDAQGIGRNLMCNPGGGGAPIACAQAPEIFLGRSSPNFEGAFTTQLTLLGRIRVYGLVDFKYGQKTFNNTFGFMCQTRLTCKENVLPLESDPIDVAIAQSNRLYWNNYLEDSGFAKLREVSVSYTMPDQWLRGFGASSASVTVAGRNLHTWTSYTGMDPELLFLANQFTRTEQTNTPSLTQLTTTFRLTF